MTLKTPKSIQNIENPPMKLTHDPSPAHKSMIYFGWNYRNDVNPV